VEFTLHSCLLVNRFWCRLTVRILWRNILNFRNYQERPLEVEISILSILIACLPNESKELLRKNNIFISPPTPNPPLFNYAKFCNVLPTRSIDNIVFDVLKAGLTNYSFFNKRKNLVTNEIIKMFTSQISSLKKLIYYDNDLYHINFSFNYFPGAKDLSELCCDSSLSSDIFYQLSQLCHNLQSISINLIQNVSNELKELISLQNNLKNIILLAFYDLSWADIIPTLTKHSDSITKLCLYSNDDNDDNDLPLSFIELFSNLQEITISFPATFAKLQYCNFSKLKTLKILYRYTSCPEFEYII
jgi:hypothetical protein